MSDLSVDTSGASKPSAELMPRAFFDVLYRGSTSGRLSIWDRATKLSVHVDPSEDELDDLCGKTDIYFGVALRRDGLSANQRGKFEDCVALPGFYLDLDLDDGTGAHAAKNLPTRAQADEILALYPEPTLIVESGHGLHAYWLFDALASVSAELEAKSEAFQRRAIEHAESKGLHVDYIGNLDRVLRVPMTFNGKIASASVAVLVTKADGPRYASAEALLQAAGIDSVAHTSASRASRTSESSAEEAPTPKRAAEQTDEWVREKLAAIKKPGSAELVAKVLAGESFAPVGSRDRTLQRIASIVAYVAPDRDPVELAGGIMRASLEALRVLEPGYSIEENIEWAAEKIARAQEDARRDRAAKERQDAGLANALGVKQAQSKPSPKILGSRIGAVANKPKIPVRSYPTGLPDLDKLLGGGVSTRQLTTVLGPPGNGKSQFCIALAVNVAKLSKPLPTLYVSTELEADELLARYQGMLTDQTWRDLVRGQGNRSSIDQAVASLPIQLVGCDELPRDGSLMESIEATAHAMAEEFGVSPLIIIDYTQDLARGTDTKNLRGKIGDIATELRQLAQATDGPLVAVSSVSRAYYSDKRREELRDGKDPTAYLAAAKESGDVDYASAAVLFLDVDPANGGSYRLAQIAVAKSRHGETGFAGARFYGASGRWESDARAVAELTSEARKETKRAAKEKEADLKVLETLKKLKARGDALPTSKTALKGMCQGNGASNWQAIERLCATGTIVETDEGLDIDPAREPDVLKPPKGIERALAARGEAQHLDRSMMKAAINARA